MEKGDLDWLVRSLQRKDITDPEVLDAIANTPRDVFISEPSLKTQAYQDSALPIECGQTISQPFVVAYMTERLHLMPHHSVLEIGTGSGYQTAVLARLAAHIYTIERHQELHDLAVERFKQLGLFNITAICSDGTRGWPEPRLFERIIVTAAACDVPQQLLAQLAPCGAMIMPLGVRYNQRVALITQGNGRAEIQKLLPVRFVPLRADH